MHNFIGVAPEIEWCDDCGCIRQKAHIVSQTAVDRWLYHMPGHEAALKQPECPPISKRNAELLARSRALRAE